MNEDFKLTFHGASKTVTGSCYELEIRDKKYLIDCGMFQGPDVYELNFRDFPFNPKEIDAVFLTHAHIDHCGLLPKLYREGFNGTIYCTPPTRKILDFILLDAAKIQENNLKFRKTKPLYHTSDSVNALRLMKTVKFDKQQTINDLQITYRRSSHILGAGSIELDIGNKIITFSGDIGRRNPEIIEGFSAYNSKPNYVVMESLYGNKNHPNIDEAKEKLCNLITQTIDRDGNVIIPVFALHRLQEILVHLNTLIKADQLPYDVQIIIDAPLGANILDLYTRHSGYYSKEFAEQKDPFGLNSNNITFVTSGKQSLRIRKKRRAIILTGGGMMDGGRVINHLNSFVENKNCSIAIVGFQAEGTLGRKFLERPEIIKLNKKILNVKIQISEIYGFSAHGDRDDLVWWLSRFEKNSLEKVFLVHSEPDQSKAFREYITSNNVISDDRITIPSIGDSHTLAL